MGDGISEGIEEESAESENHMNNLNYLEDQLVGNDNEELMALLLTQQWHLVRLASPQHASLKKLVKPH